MDRLLNKVVEQIREKWLALLAVHRAIAIIRAPTVDTGLSMAKAAAAGGLRLIEVAWNNNAQPDAMMADAMMADAMMAAIRQALPDCVVGVGTVMNRSDLMGAIAANAQFCFTPHTDPALISMACQHHLPIIAGAMTPTEVITAWNAGAASVKVFPISTLGNGAYIRSLLGPLGPIPLIPTGGVTSESSLELIKAGAVAVGLSTALFPKAEVEAKDWAAIEARSRYLLTLLAPKV